MYLVTSNQAKYKEFKYILDSLEIQIVEPKFPIIEPQGSSLEEIARQKAKFAFDQFSAKVMVDEAGLELSAYPGFPGPMTRFVLKTLGKKGLQKLTQTDNQATMLCVIAYTDGIKTLIWKGNTKGFLNFNKNIDPKGPGPLYSWFISENGSLAHREQAIFAMQSYVRSKTNGQI